MTVDVCEPMIQPSIARTARSGRQLAGAWMRGMLVGMCCLLMALLSPGVVARDMVPVFTYRPGESSADTRYEYDTAVLKLALDLTVPKYGPYRLEASPAMNFPRAIDSLARNVYPNFFVKLSYEQRLVDELSLTFARYPIDRGIVGYRVCFTNPAAKERLRQARTLDDLRGFTIGQGSGWADVSILRHNGFTVPEVSSYESLFLMVARERFDLFCRGTNELLEEFQAHQSIPNLVYDESFSLAYPLPRFFFTHRANAKAAQRIEEGVLMAHANGSLVKLWQQKYGASIDFVKLHARNIYWLDNPEVRNLTFNYRQYFYDPLHDARNKAAH